MGEVLVPEFKLNKPQFEFNQCTKAFKCFVGGYRSGKTFVLCVEAFIKALEYPGIDMAYFAPTYPLIKTIFWPTIEEVGEMFGFTVEIKKADKEVFLYYHGSLYSKIICRSMDNPASIVGFQVNHAMIDEIDCMKKDKADDAWKKIVARLSSDGFDEHVYEDEGIEYVIDAMRSNTASFATTPEGYNWVYEFFVRQIREKPELEKYYQLIKAKTTENAKNLPHDYIDKLYETYPAELVKAYVNGEFVNLTSGTIYNSFSRKVNHTDKDDDGTSDIHIGMDFNVDQMAAVAHLLEKKVAAYAIYEFFGAKDTPDLIKQIKNKYPGRKIYIYPDASGANRSTKNASTSDIKLLKQAGFRVIVDSKNPSVRDRINAMNSAFCNAKGEVKYYVNTNHCTFFTECLEQQVYDKGEPDKKGGKDHMNDAAGYFIHKNFPAEKPRQKTRFGNIRMA